MTAPGNRFHSGKGICCNGGDTSEFAAVAAGSGVALVVRGSLLPLCSDEFFLRFFDATICCNVR